MYQSDDSEFERPIAQKKALSSGNSTKLNRMNADMLKLETTLDI